MAGNRLVEFFEGDNGRLSMARLLMFGSFFPSSYVVMKCADKPNISEILMWYIGGFVLGYVGGKGVDVLGGRNANQTYSVPGGSPSSGGDGVEGGGLEGKSIATGRRKTRAF